MLLKLPYPPPLPFFKNNRISLLQLDMLRSSQLHLRSASLAASRAAVIGSAAAPVARLSTRGSQATLSSSRKAALKPAFYLQPSQWQRCVACFVACLLGKASTAASEAIKRASDEMSRKVTDSGAFHPLYALAEALLYSILLQQHGVSSSPASLRCTPQLTVLRILLQSYGDHQGPTNGW